MKGCCFFVSLMITLGRGVLADTIFDNTTHDLCSRFEPGPLEIGDEIRLAGQARYLTNFAFEYWGTNAARPENLAFIGVVRGRVHFYKNDGPAFHGFPAPGTQVWDSGWFAVSPTSRRVVEFSPGNGLPPGGIYLPESALTWSVQFCGQGPGDRVGIDFYSPADIGVEFPDYWENNGSTWVLRTNAVAADFAARMESTLVPNPAIPVVHLSGTGLVMLISWPAWATNFVLETTDRLGAGCTWNNITNDIRWVDNNFVVTTNIHSGRGFFRLRR